MLVLVLTTALRAVRAMELEVLAKALAWIYGGNIALWGIVGMFHTALVVYESIVRLMWLYAVSYMS
jgi:hypothetical protein